MYKDRTYAIVDTVAFTDALTAGQISASLLFENVLETNIDTLRHTVTGVDLFVIKSDSQTSVAYLTAKAEEFSIPYTMYDYNGVLEVMATSAWSMPMSGMEMETLSVSDFTTSTKKKKATKVKKPRKPRKPRKKKNI